MKRFLAFCLAVAGCSSAQAAPLRRADVAAEPTWVIHINCDALRPTGVGKYLLSEMARPDVEPKFAAFQTFFSFDPRKQLHGVTFYSTSNLQDDGAMLVYADFDPGRLVTLAKSAHNAQITNHGAHVIYSWLDERTGVGNGKIRFYAAIKNDCIVFTQRRARVESALDVLDHVTPDLSSTKNFPRLGSPGDSNIVEAAARKLELPDSAPNAALFRMANSLRLQLTERDHVVNATLNFEAVSESFAQQAVLAVRGAIAVAKMQRDKPEATKFAEALSITHDGTAVVATATMPESDVIEMVRSYMEKDDSKKPEKN